MFDENPNGHVVPFNDLLTYLDGCNTAIYPLGSTEAAKVKVYYMTKYIVKDQGAFKKLLSVASTAYKLTKDFPNMFVEQKKNEEEHSSNCERINDVNSDLSSPTISVSTIGESLPTSNITPGESLSIGSNLTQTEYKSIKRFGNTLLNTMRSTYERSSQESASKILGYSASYSSIKPWFIFMKSAKGQLKLTSQSVLEDSVLNCWKPCEDVVDETYSIEDNGYITDDSSEDVSNEEYEDCINSDDEDEKLNDIHGNDNHRTEYVDIVHSGGSAQGFKTTNQYEAYRYRSIQARHLTLYEYTAIMFLEPFEKEEIEKGINISPSAVDGNYKKKKKSREENSWNYLHDQHPMRLTHKEKIRSKQVLPVISTRTPRLLHEVPEDDCAMKSDSALFILPYFVLLIQRRGF